MEALIADNDIALGGLDYWIVYHEWTTIREKMTRVEYNELVLRVKECRVLE